MFTVKATYRGETRKITFPECLTFPTYYALCKQLYRVFPLNDSYHLSKLLFSPDAFSPARILIAVEVKDEADYRKGIAQFHGRSYANGLLRFSVFDDTPHKEPRRSMDTQSINSNADESILTDTNSTADDRRPEVPPKPAGMFENTPFQYISALSHTPSVTSRSSRRASTLMDVDSVAATDEQRNALQEVIDTLRSDLDKSVSMLETIAPAKSSDSSNASKTASASQSDLTNGRQCPHTHSTYRPHGRHHERHSDSLNSLFEEGAFPSAGPTQRGSHGGFRSRRCGRAAQAESQQPVPVVHNNVWCDACHQVIVGVRHKCLDCPDYDLCTACIGNEGAEKHNPFHEFFEIREPGRVIVHTVYAGEGERQAAGLNAPQATVAQPAEPTPTRVMHGAVCDLCESTVIGDRYKCFNCPDFDTCSACFAITKEQHPGHSFMKMANEDVFIRRARQDLRAHYATCNACSHLIRGVRYKCMHPECPDFDLCDKCEAMPISVHPESHPMLKMKTVDTIIPTVYRVGGFQAVKPVHQAEEVPEHEEIRSITPKPTDAVPVQLLDLPETPQSLTRDDDARSPFADPPTIEPIGALSSLASSFEASLASQIGLQTPESFVLAPRQTEASPPSFVEDLNSVFASYRASPPAGSPLPVVGALNALQIEEEAKAEEVITQEENILETSLADLISQNQSLIALAEEVKEEEVLPVGSPAAEVPIPEAPLSATFISDVTVTDGQVFPPGAEFVKCWRMMNDSTRDWPEGTELIFVAGESLAINSKSEVVKVGSVKAGTEVDVWTGELKAPDAPGRYVGYWRLRDGLGNVFGNSIWVEINVAENEHSSDESNMSASSIIMMPRAGSGSGNSGVAVSVGEVESTVGDGTATIPSTTEDGNSDIDSDSDVSLIDLVSDDEDNIGWEDARSHATGASSAQVVSSPPSNARQSPPPAAGMDYVLLFDDSSDSDF